MEMRSLAVPAARGSAALGVAFEVTAPGTRAGTARATAVTERSMTWRIRALLRGDDVV
jgi:hypothetical protein